MSDGPPGARPGIRRAMSAASDPVVAAGHLHAELAGPGVVLVLFFCAPEYETPAFTAALERLFAGVLVVGCTSAGEIGPSGYHENSVTALSLSAPDFAAVAGLLLAEGDLDVGRCGETIALLRDELDARTRAWHGEVNRFALLLIDGTTQREDAVAAFVGGAMVDIPVLGGSAGDALAFKHTSVFAGGRFHDQGAVVILVATRRQVWPFRNQHFVASDKRVVVTGADPQRRIVTELDAEPAVSVYARLIGCDEAELTPMVFATHPLVVRLGGAEYVRSIQKANPDGSLSFYCAVDEGLVLTLSDGRDLLRQTEGMYEELRVSLGVPEAVIGFECVLNRLEAERSQIKHRLSRLHAANNVTGFASFGEQWGSMHVTQTFTGIAIGRRVLP